MFFLGLLTPQKCMSSSTTNKLCWPYASSSLSKIVFHSFFSVLSNVMFLSLYFFSLLLFVSVLSSSLYFQSLVLILYFFILFYLSHSPSLSLFLLYSSFWPSVRKCAIRSRAFVNMSDAAALILSFSLYSTLCST